MRSRILAACAAVALAVTINGTASASDTADQSDPAARAILSRAEAMLTPAGPAALARRVSGVAARPHDGTPTMVALAKALPHLGKADQARAKVLLRQTTTGATKDRCGEETKTSYNAATTADGHFVIYYTSNPSSPNFAAEAYVDRVETVLAKVWSTEIGTLGYPAPRVPTGESATPITLCNLSMDLYGYCSGAAPVVGSTTAADCTLRNSYDYPIFTQNGSTALMALQVTAAHEFFHAIQFGMDADTPLWSAEGSAVWMENQVYPASRDYLQYMAATGIQNPTVPFNVDVSPADASLGEMWTFTPYGDGIFFRFLAGWLKSPRVVREFWTYLANHPHDPPLKALITGVLAAHHRTFADAMTQWAIWNTLPPASYPDRALYTPVGWWKNVTRDRSNRSFASGTATVRPLADRPVRIHRGSKANAATKLRLTIVGPRREAGGWFTYRIRKSDGTNATYTRPMPASGIASVDVPFDTSVTDVFITVSNLASVKRTFQVRTAVLG